MEQRVPGGEVEEDDEEIMVLSGVTGCAAIWPITAPLTQTQVGLAGTTLS